MIRHWCIVVSDLDEVLFAIIGPFDLKADAEKVEGELYACDVITTIHPYSVGLKWVGNIRKNGVRAMQVPFPDREDDWEEAHEEYRKLIARQLL